MNSEVIRMQNRSQESKTGLTIQLVNSPMSTVIKRLTYLN